MYKRIRLQAEEEGNMMVEYALRTAFITLLSIGAVMIINIFSVKVQAFFGNISQVINWLQQ